MKTTRMSDSVNFMSDKFDEFLMNHVNILKQKAFENRIEIIGVPDIKD